MNVSTFLRAQVAGRRTEVRNLMRHTQVRATAGTAGVNIAIMLVGSVGGLFLARALGPTHRGDLVAILQWPAMIGSVVSLGITQSTCYWISRRPDKSIPLMSTAVAASLATGVVIAALGPWLAGVIGRNAEVRSDLALVLALTPVYIAGGVWISALQATSIWRWNLTRALQPLVYLFAVVGLWSLGKLTLITVVAAFAISVAGQALYAAIVARRVIGRHTWPDPSLLGPLYAYGSKVWLSSVPQLVNVSVDQLVLSVMPSVIAAQLGNYTVAASLSWLALPASTAFGSVAFPRIARIAGAGAILRIERISLIGAGLTAGTTIGLICLLAPAVVPTLFGNGYRDAIIALWLLAPGTVFLALNRVLGDVLQGRGKPLIRSAGEGLGAIVTIALLFALIPRYGIRGAAVASSVTYAVVFSFLLLGLYRVRRQAAIAGAE
jgi:O-antigen/teichoic acid export membrane protein